METRLTGNTQQDRPACAECRRRKLGCSKELPACKECRRLSAVCVYGVREKPGVKSGAVENLNKRVDQIEQVIYQLQEQAKSSPQNDGRSEPRSEIARDISDVFQYFAREIRETKSRSQQSSEDPPQNPVTRSPRRHSEATSRPHLKRKNILREDFNWGELVLDFQTPNNDNYVSASKLLDHVLDNYFSQIHPWLPMLHEKTFRKRYSEQVYSVDLELILRAMVVAALKFAIPPNTSLASFSHIPELIKHSRDWVMLHALSSLSLENLQGLLIVTFNDIGSGEASNAWSIVGSLTRTVEYLQLSVEIEDTDEQPLIKPCPFLPQSTDWTEMETRRRVFWNIFNLDRVCSVMTGWNTSLTSDDVHRRLPVDGSLWRRQEPVLAPYFGIWDKSAGRIGNSIAFLEAKYPAIGRSPDEEPYSPVIVTDHNSVADEMSTIGAFAYCIEATESMSRITTYFLQQKVDLSKQKQISSWLMRFKELDLRLVHWKMFLPGKWKDTNISRHESQIIMDPNLTLAHITHNASMILLHQLIAYPPAHWDWATRLPSRCSADTCQTAASETSSITEKYLQSPTRSKIVNSQFLFCVFIAARVLLVHWRYYNDTEPIPEFSKLVDSLDTLSIRWEGAFRAHTRTLSNLAAKYARILRRLHKKCVQDVDFRINVLDYASELRSESDELKDITKTAQNVEKEVEEAGGRPSSSVRTGEPLAKRRRSFAQIPETRNLATAQLEVTGSGSIRSRDTQPGAVLNPSVQGASTPLRFDPASFQMPINQVPLATLNTAEPSNVASTSMPLDEFTYISQLFHDQQFLDRDRVISYDEGMFAASMDWLGNGG